MIVIALFSFAPSLGSAESLARMDSGCAEMEKPLQSETVRERSSSYADFLSSPKIIDRLVLEVENVSEQNCSVDPGWMEGEE